MKNINLKDIPWYSGYYVLEEAAAKGSKIAGLTNHSALIVGLTCIINELQEKVEQLEQDKQDIDHNN